MRRRLILFDVDDTIIDHSAQKSEIPKATSKAIQLLQEKGHIVGLATGRSKAHIKHIMELLDMDTAVSFGGHIVTLYGKEIYRHTLDVEDVNKLIKKTYKTLFPVVCFDENNIYVKDFFGRVKHALYKETNTLLGEELVTDITPMKKLGKTKREYLAMMVFKNKIKHPEQYKHLDFNPWGNQGYEVYAKGVSKLSGIEILAKMLNIGMEDVYVFGDNYNDIHMLKNIKNSTAVGNGVAAAKEVASYVSPPINEGGIMTACIELGLLDESDNV